MSRCINDPDGFYMDALDYQGFIEGCARRLSRLSNELQELCDDGKVAVENSAPFEALAESIVGVAEEVENESKLFRQWLRD